MPAIPIDRFATLWPATELVDHGSFYLDEPQSPAAIGQELPVGACRNRPEVEDQSREINPSPLFTCPSTRPVRRVAPDNFVTAICFAGCSTRRHGAAWWLVWSKPVVSPSTPARSRRVGPALRAGRWAGPLGDEVINSFLNAALDRAQAQNGNTAFL